MKLPAALLVAFLALPVVALVVTGTPADFVAGLRDPLVLPALRLSLLTTSLSLTAIVLLGTPLAWLLARNRLRAVEVIVQLPVVIPPAVAGLALLLAFGRHGLLGRIGLHVAFSTGAVVLAEIFVAAPFYIQAATNAFRRLDEELLIVARTLGARPFSTFIRVALPIARPALVSGAAMAWARALGEFGATLMFAGNLSGRTQTLPLAIYTLLESDVRAARSLSILLVAAAFALLFVVRSGASLVFDGERE